MSGSLVEEARPLAIVPAVVPQPAPQPEAGTPPGQDPGSQDEPGQPAPAIYQDDPDAIALAAARAEAEAEEKGTPAQRQQPTRQQQQAPRPAQPGQAIMVPKARLDESLRAQKAASDQVAYLQGVVATLQAQGQGGTAPAAPASQPQAAQPAQQPDVGQTIAQHQASVEEAAAKFDAGEITMTEFVKVQTEANNGIAALREASMAAPRQTIGLADAEIMAAHQAQLEQQHPWALVLSVPELQLLAEYARGEAIALGRPIGSGPAETVRLRQAVAELSDMYGPRWYPDRVATANQNQQQRPPAQQQTPPARPLSPQAQQGLRKIALAQSHPPNINHAGSPGNTGDMYSEDRIAMMTTDEIEALPPDIRRRYLG